MEPSDFQNLRKPAFPEALKLVIPAFPSGAASTSRVLFKGHSDKGLWLRKNQALVGSITGF